MERKREEGRIEENFSREEWKSLGDRIMCSVLVQYSTVHVLVQYSTIHALLLPFQQQCNHKYSVDLTIFTVKIYIFLIRQI